MAAAVGTVGFYALVVWGLYQVDERNPFIRFPVTLLFFTFGLWPLWFLFFSTLIVLRNGLLTDHLHPALPAFLAAALSWTFLDIDLLRGSTAPGPPWVQLCLTWGGPATVSCLALVEIARSGARPSAVGS
ncbi:hypothetical protein ACFYOG_17090 [Streptomyces sp. NPDC007818]|uniref:hypothetical protein n=1 Tax=Streptomyces sp. NPDC007818 TaxID=3364780 RepID=UPI0036D1ED0F